MPRKDFNLVPFENNELTSQLKIEGEVAIVSSEFRIKYKLSGDIKQVVIPPQVDTPRRAEQLWKQTCFEVFISREGCEPYVEWNFSPSHDWNVMTFDSYRNREKRKSFAVPRSQKILTRGAKSEFILETAIDIDQFTDFWEVRTPFEFGPTVVLLHQNGEYSYWARTHLGTKADFHFRQSFQFKF